MRLLAALIWLFLFAWAMPAAAQNPIHRCIGSNGSPVFTDQPCDAMQATSVHAATRPLNDAASSQPPPLLCAARLADLRKSVIDAFADHDPNRLAGLMLWGGYGSGAAIADIRSLAALMRHPLLDLGPSEDPAAASSAGDPFTEAAPTPAPAPSGTQLILHVAGSAADGSQRELRFDIVRRSGCLWLRNAN
ncbi:MAG: DUF4124 domain-containing protein [Rhodanobacter sp.]